MLAATWRKNGVGRILCGKDVAKEDLLDGLWLDTSALDGSCSQVNMCAPVFLDLLYLPLMACDPSWVALRLEMELSRHKYSVKIEEYSGSLPKEHAHWRSHGGDDVDWREGRHDDCGE